MVEWGASILTMQSVTNSAFSHIVILSLVKSHEYFLATLYGGAIIIASTSYFGWRLRIATQTVDNKPTVNSVELFKGIFIRFVMVIVLLALGLGWLKLSPAGILSGFIVAQLAFWFSRSSYGVTRRK